MPTGALVTSRFMPLTLSEPAVAQPLDPKDRAELWFYRIGAYLLLNVMDEPAWLALMFC